MTQTTPFNLLKKRLSERKGNVMKLSEFLDNANYKYIKLGTNGGSFLYCGELEKLDTKIVDKKYMRYLRRRYKEHLENVKRYKKDGITIRETIFKPNVKKIYRCGRKMTIEEFTEFRIEQEEKRYKKYEIMIKEYKKLAKREINDIYDSELYEDCIIVIVDGNEHGNVEDL